MKSGGEGSSSGRQSRKTVCTATDAKSQLWRQPRYEETEALRAFTGHGRGAIF